jgi:hypothetical protein
MIMCLPDILIAKTGTKAKNDRKTKQKNKNVLIPSYTQTTTLGLFMYGQFFFSAFLFLLFFFSGHTNNHRVYIPPPDSFIIILIINKKRK